MCAYCNKNKFDSIDHIIPWRMIKNDQFWNMLPICKSWNSKKFDRIWDIGSEGRKVLKKSIGIIVDNIQNNPDFLNQVKRHFLYTGKKQNFKDKTALFTDDTQMSIAIAEVWRKRRYKAAFIAKLSDAESEACETRVWIEFAKRCKYLADPICDEMDKEYDQIIGQIVRIINEADKWLIK